MRSLEERLSSKESELKTCDPLDKHLVSELELFIFNKQYLKGLLTSSSQTLSLFSERKATEPRESYQQDDLLPADLAAPASGQWDGEFAVLSQPVCLVLMGLCGERRAAVLDALLGEPLLPLTADDPAVGSPTDLPTGSDPAGWPTVVLRAACDDFAVLMGDWSGIRRERELTVINTDRGRQIIPPSVDRTQQATGCGAEEQQDRWISVGLNHTLLRADHLRIVVAPSGGSAGVHSHLEGVLPVYLYALSDSTPAEQELSELIDLHRLTGGQSVYFIAQDDPLTSTPSPAADDRGQPALSLHWPHRPRRAQGRRSAMDSSGPEEVRQCPGLEQYCRPQPGVTLQQLQALGYEFDCRPPASLGQSPDDVIVSSQLTGGADAMLAFLPYLSTLLQRKLLMAAHQMNRSLNQVLRAFILSAFDMAREIQITPRRLEYARQKETELFVNLMNIANNNQIDMAQLINRTAADMREQLLMQAVLHQFQDGDISEAGEVRSARQLQQCTAEIQNLLLGELNRAVAGQLVGSVDYMQERFIGTLQRCLESLEGHEAEGADASNALKQILNSAYTVELSVGTSSTVISSLWERLKQLLDVMPWKPPPCVDAQWRCRIATEMLDNINELKLSKIMCSQLRERLRCAHEAFVRSMRRLETQLTGQLEQTERDRVRMKKLHAPHVARLALQAAAFVDAAKFGVPRLWCEIGRGQYGVVYSSRTWAGREDWAVKSVIPPDDRHWNDLSMEYYYTRSLPEHERIVSIRGIVIDYNYSHSRMSAALLLMDRLHSDLYLALQDGLDLRVRLQVALDVAQGARFLHSQGLIHRDIKLKNVLLDTCNRGRLTDLGFCKPEAMISGSVVGTPIHMAPELFSGKYDNSVDVYAFGVLLWYVLTNDVRIPAVYEQCDNKTALWECVKRGVRPRRPAQCSDAAWELTQACWRGQPRHRPLFGVVELKLADLLHQLDSG